MYADRSQEFPSVSAVCVRYLRPDTEALRLGNAFMPSSISGKGGSLESVYMNLIFYRENWEGDWYHKAKDSKPSGDSTA